MSYIDECIVTYLYKEMQKMICKDSLSFFFSGKQIGVEHVYI